MFRESIVTMLGRRFGVYVNYNIQYEAVSAALSHVNTEVKISLCFVNSAALPLLSAQPVSTKGVLH